ncbi:MAG: hypothetical protein H7Y15_04635, partial [Pseudonocardia sp.]|nr:hypothetical protein [Pseudonocardia sp.]
LTATVFGASRSPVLLPYVPQTHPDLAATARLLVATVVPVWSGCAAGLGMVYGLVLLGVHRVAGPAQVRGTATPRIEASSS